MKSEKAMEYIGQHDWPDENTNIRSVYCYHVQEAIELAEQEAEERMREKAIKAHRACCPLNELQCIHRDRDDYTCTYDCRYVTSFIQKLNEE